MEKIAFWPKICSGKNPTHLPIFDPFFLSAQNPWDGPYIEWPRRSNFSGDWTPFTLKSFPSGSHRLELSSSLSTFAFEWCFTSVSQVKLLWAHSLVSASLAGKPPPEIADTPLAAVPHGHSPQCVAWPLQNAQCQVFEAVVQGPGSCANNHPEQGDDVKLAGWEGRLRAKKFPWFTFPSQAKCPCWSNSAGVQLYDEPKIEIIGHFLVSQILLLFIPSPKRAKTGRFPNFENMKLFQWNLKDERSEWLSLGGGEGFSFYGGGNAQTCLSMLSCKNRSLLSFWAAKRFRASASSRSAFWMASWTEKK